MKGKLHYRSIAQKAPWLWSYAFHLSDSPKLARLEHRLALPFITPRLLALLESFQSDLILSVHPLLTYNVKQALDRYAPHIPFAMLLCDPASTHATWYTERDARVGATSGVIVAERPTWVVSTLKQIANRAGETVFRVLIVIRLPIL